MDQRAKSSKKPLIIVLTLLAALIAAFAIIYFTNIGQTQAGAKTLAIEIIHGDGSQKAVQVNTDAEYLRGALEEQNLISGSESEFGLFIITVDGETANESKQEWWCITKNGEAHYTGVDTTVIADGEAYELTLTTGY